MDKITYKYWFLNVFLPNVRKFTNEPVALIMDNCPGHDLDLVDPLGQVKIFLLPINSTSVCQPLDQGIISVLKTNYKYKMLFELIKAYANYEQLQNKAIFVTNGKKGLKYGLDAHLLDAANLFNLCWQELKESAIIGCWIRSNCLPEHMLNELRQVNCEPDTLQSDLALITNLMKNTSFFASQTVSDYLQMEDNPELIHPPEIFDIDL